LIFLRRKTNGHFGTTIAQKVDLIQFEFVVLGRVNRNAVIER
jgi:hypothetical protein